MRKKKSQELTDWKNLAIFVDFPSRENFFHNLSLHLIPATFNFF